MSRLAARRLGRSSRWPCGGPGQPVQARRSDPPAPPPALPTPQSFCGVYLARGEDQVGLVSRCEGIVVGWRVVGPAATVDAAQCGRPVVGYTPNLQPVKLSLPPPSLLLRGGGHWPYALRLNPTAGRGDRASSRRGASSGGGGGGAEVLPLVTPRNTSIQFINAAS